MNEQEKIFRQSVKDAENFYFEAVDMKNLNRMSIYKVVRGISHDQFISKLNGSSRDWAEDL
jgi:hypothetical protein